MPEKTKTSRKRNTTFCQSKPSQLVKTVVVYMKDAGVWVVCKGKFYRNSFLKYFHNGKSAIVNCDSYRYLGEGYNEAQIQEIVSSMNLEILEVKQMKERRDQRFAEQAANQIVDDWDYFTRTNIRINAPVNFTGINEILNANPND